MSLCLCSPWQSSHFSLRVSIIRHQIKIPFSPFSFLIHSHILWFLSLTCTAILFSPFVYFGVPFHLFAIASVCLDINLDSSTQCCKVFPSDPSSCATFTLQQHQWIGFYCFLICLYNCNRFFRHQKFLVLIPAQNKAHADHHIVVFLQGNVHCWIVFSMFWASSCFCLEGELCVPLFCVCNWCMILFWCASKLCLLVSVFISSKCHFSHFKEEIEKGPMSNEETAPKSKAQMGACKITHVMAWFPCIHHVVVQHTTW